LRKLIICLAFIVLILVLAGAASATGPVTPAYTPATPTYNSAIDGHKIVYEKKSTITNKNIYVTDLSTGSSKAVSTSSYNEENPDISGNIVVWQKWGSSGSQIYWKDISKTNPAALVHAATGKNQLNPSISGNYVVWQQYAGPDSASNGGLTDYNIVGYNLATHTYYLHIASSNLHQGNPDISGNTVVYEQYTNLGTTDSPNWKMQAYKTIFSESNAGSKIYASSNDQFNPVVSRTGRAAWERYSVSGYDIAWVDNVWIPTGIHYEATTNNDINPAIYGNMLVWRQQKSSGSLDFNIYMRNLGTTGIALTKTLVIGTAYDQYEPAVGGDNKGIFVSYTDMKDGYPRVYYRNMAKPPTATAGSPARNAVNVPTNQPITTTFNEPIKSGTGHIELYEAATKTLVGIFPAISGNILTMTPTLLKKATKYTITLYQGSLTDLIGNPIALYSRSFTTGNT
jgi:beta propeller repeat protein